MLTHVYNDNVLDSGSFVGAQNENCTSQVKLINVVYEKYIKCDLLSWGDLLHIKNGIKQ